MAVSRTHQARRITRLRQDSVETTYSLYLGCVCEWVDTGSGSAPSPAPLAAAEPAARAWMGAALAVLLSCAAEVMSRSLSTAAASVSPRLIWSCRACCAESEKKVKRRFRRFRSHRQSEIHLTDTGFCHLCRSHTFSSRYKCCHLRNSLHHHTLIGSTIRTYDRPQIPKLLAPLHVPSMVHLIETSSCRPSLL